MILYKLCENFLLNFNVDYESKLRIKIISFMLIRNNQLKYKLALKISSNK